MPITYRFDPQTRVLYTVCSGHVALEETLKHFDEVAMDPAVPEGCKALLDLGALESLPDTEQVRGAAGALDKRTRRAARFGPWAIVAGRDAMYGMSRMFQVFLDQAGIESRVFRTEEEAEAWLESIDAPAA